MYDITLPKKKRPFIKIATAENDWLVMNDYKTFNQFKYEYSIGVWLSNKNIMIIINKYIDAGYGDDLIGKYFG